MSTPTSYVDPFAPAPAPSPAAANLLAANAPVSSPPVEPEKKDQWSGLVDLNLKGGNAPPRQTTQQSGPSLSMLSTNTSSTTSPAMVNRNSNAGFGTAGGFGNAPMPPPSFGAPAPSFGAPAPSFGAPAPSFGAPAPSFGAPAPSFGAPDPFASFAAQPPRPGGGFGGPVMGGPAMGSGMGMGMGSGMGGPGFSASNPSAGISMMGPGNPMGGPGMAPQGNANFGRPPATSSLDSLNWKM